jgi:hypothetical protein
VIAVDENVPGEDIEDVLRGEIDSRAGAHGSRKE